VVVVDNASTDGSPDVARACSLHPLVIELPENTGFARGNNVGIRASSGELVLLLNSDTLVPAGAVDGLVAELAAERSAAAAGPRLVDLAGVSELSFGRMIAPLAELRQKALGRLHARGVGPVRRWVERQTSRRQFPDWISGAALLVWRRDAEAVGLLDERFFMYTEDVDFCAALRARGRRVLFTPVVTITHARGRSAASAPVATRDAYRRSHVAFYRKHHPRWAWLLEAYLRAKGEWPPKTARSAVLS
jgi:GT2 family glycosyltransferase